MTEGLRRKKSMENKDIVRKILLFYLVAPSMLDVHGYVCNVYAFIIIIVRILGNKPCK